MSAGSRPKWSLRSGARKRTPGGAKRRLWLARAHWQTGTEAEAGKTVLVMGASGVFGARLVAGLLRSTSFAVILAGRNERRLIETARRLAAEAPGGADRMTTIQLDAARITAAALGGTGAFAVVDAAGPYQGSDYGLARAAIAAGLHYLDLADARDFVAGFPALDAAAKAAGVSALTGASSTPALSNAVLDQLTAGWTRVDTVDIAISPGNRAPRGLSVVRSILSYAGRPVPVFTGGQWTRRPGWGMTVRRAMPGLGPRWLALAETPDLDIVPQRFAVRGHAVFRAGLELSFLHLGLLAASLPVRAGLLRSLAPLSRLFRAAAAPLAPLGTDRGGMTVEATGRGPDGQPDAATWSLVAEAGDGPFIPTLPAIAALRALSHGAVPAGAGPCAGLLSLGQIEHELATRRITTAIETSRGPPLYEQVLGAAFHTLPAAVRRMHQPAGVLHAKGSASVDGADTVLARLVAGIVGFPAAAAEVPLAVEMTACGGRETWTRTFGGARPFRSILSRSARPGHILERFGPLRFELALPASALGITGMPVRSWRLGPIPLPRALAPASVVREWSDGGRFHFDVDVRLPLKLGRVVRYRGWLVPE